MPSLLEQLTERYSALQLVESRTNMAVYHSTILTSNVPVTVKTVKNPHLELSKYLRKLKDVKADQVIRVYDVLNDATSLVLVTERVTYGTLKKALSRCRRLQDSDAFFVAKNLLLGHKELLKMECHWFGTQDDIQITDTGLKLSWNNGAPYSHVNPFPGLLAALVKREASQNSILPFPPSKVMNEMIDLSNQSASEISLSPHLKKKDKPPRRQTTNWLSLKETRFNDKYFEQISCFGVHKDYGFVRVKVYSKGKVSPNILAFSKTKPTFTRVIDCYDDKDQTIMVSEYSNDGNLQSYVSKLKTAGVSLKEDQIEFFFFSLFQPLKSVQASSVRSLNMLNLRNIYIDEGIPKIGEPIPFNQSLQEALISLSDVPDFYHPNFKKDPTGHSETFDTYSLGVLLYKLMYTEYPIFPNGRVHVPTTPAYNKRLKVSLEIFLNEGGKLSDIESRIEVADSVAKAVQENKEKLKPVGERLIKMELNYNENSHSQHADESHQSENAQPRQFDQFSAQSTDDQGPGWFQRLWHRLAVSPATASAILFHPVQKMQSASSSRRARLSVKAILCWIVYLFIFFYPFLSNLFGLLSSFNLIRVVTVPLSTAVVNDTSTVANSIAKTNSYRIITTDLSKWQQAFNKSDKTVSSVTGGLGCVAELIDNTTITTTNSISNGTTSTAISNTITQVLYDGSSSWVLFLIGSLLAMNTNSYLSSSHLLQNSPLFLEQDISLLCITSLLLFGCNIWHIYADKSFHNKLINPIVIVGAIVFGIVMVLRIGVGKVYSPRYQKGL